MKNDMHNRSINIVSIDSLEKAKPYNKMIFGGFLEHFDNQIYGGVFDENSPLSNSDGFRIDVVEALKELKVSVIRWPGGCFVDSYHWEKGIGEKRESYCDPRWGCVEPNSFGTHEFIELCKLLDAEPYICHNSFSDIKEMSDWVAYCNASEGQLSDMRRRNGCEEPLNVKFWSVGNERYDDDYIRRVRDGAKAMKEVDPKVKVTCAGTQGGMNEIEYEVSSYLLDTAGEYLDYLSVHNYWLDRQENFPKYDYLTAITKSENPQKYISYVIEAIDAAGLRGKLKIAFDEWNLRAWQHPGFPREHIEDFETEEIKELIESRVKENDAAEQYTMADALFTASFLNACLRHCEDVEMANIAPLVNTRGPLFVHSKGIVKRTHFHAMSMYANLLQDYVVDAQVKAMKLSNVSSSVNVIDALATVDKCGRNYSIALVNRHPSECVLCTVRIGDMELNGEFLATILCGESESSYNDIENPDRVKPEDREIIFQNGVIELPPHSLTIFEYENTI